MPNTREADCKFRSKSVEAVLAGPLTRPGPCESWTDLESLFKSQAAANGFDIARDEPVELRCSSEQYSDATFLVYWPRGSERIHMIVPKKFATGRA